MRDFRSNEAAGDAKGDEGCGARWRCWRSSDVSRGRCPLRVGYGPGRRDRARFGRELGHEELGRAGDGCQRGRRCCGVEIGAAPAAENVFAGLVGDIVRELEDDAALDGGTAGFERSDGARKGSLGVWVFGVFGILGFVPEAMNGVGDLLELFCVERAEAERIFRSACPGGEWAERDGRWILELGKFGSEGGGKCFSKTGGKVDREVEGTGSMGHRRFESSPELFSFFGVVADVADGKNGSGLAIDV